MQFLSCTVMFAGVNAQAMACLRDVLSMRGLDLRSVPDAAAVFSSFDEVLPDLVVVPETLPDMAATRLCQHLRLNAATRGMPVVVLLSARDPAREHELLDRGADACFCMEDDPVILLFRICALLREYGADAAEREGVSFRQPTISVVTAPGGALWSWPGLRDLPARARGQQAVSADGALVDMFRRNGQKAQLVDDPDRLDLAGNGSGGGTPPDCVVVDLTCPAFEGLALARTVAAFRRRTRQCVRVMGVMEKSADSAEKIRIAFEAGVDDLVDTDIRPDLFLARVAALVRRKSLQDEVQREEAHMESARARAALADALRRVNADLAAANRKLIDAQAKLVQSAKMASLGELAAGIAHEFNNPLAFVLAHESTAKRSVAQALQAIRLGDTQQAEAALAKGGERLASSFVGLSRLRDLVVSLRRFSRLEEGEFRRLDVPEAIGMVLTLLAPKLGEEIEVECQLEAPPELVCQAALVNQVVMNIVSNAADAILEKREGTRRAEGGAQPGKDRILLQSSLQPREGREGNDYVLRICDTGPGVPDALQERVFEPFFTTKPVGSGTGLGLATAYGVVQAHGGSIVITRSESLGGACFTIRVPYRAAEERRGENVA